MDIFLPWPRISFFIPKAFSLLTCYEHLEEYKKHMERHLQKQALEPEDYTPHGNPNSLQNNNYALNNVNK